MAATIRAFVNLNREENPDAKEEDIEADDKDAKIAELEKVKVLKESFKAQKDRNCYEIVEVNSDLPFRHVLSLLDKL